MPEILNLDELYGQQEPIVVRHGGREYDLLRPEAMGPTDYLHFNRISVKVQSLQQSTAPEDEQAVEMEALLTEMLAMVSPALAAAPELTFAKKVACIRYYNEAVSPKAPTPETVEAIAA
jgi:hypothetical protein